MILFEVMARQLPFQDTEVRDIPKLILDGARPALERVPSKCPECLQAIMVACWSQERAERPAFLHICQGFLAGGWLEALLARADAQLPNREVPEGVVRL